MKNCFTGRINPFLEPRDSITKRLRMDNIEETWFIVVNPHAGSGRTAKEWKKIEKSLKDRGIRYEYRLTDCKYHATEIVLSASREGFRRFVAVGGDGTIHEVLDGIMLFRDSFPASDASVSDRKLPSLSDFTLAVIPVGSGNDWIRGHNVPDDVEMTLDLIKSESFSMQDVVKVTSDSGVSYMINIGGVGFDARVCERVNRRKDMGKRGRLLYVWSLVYNFFHYRPLPLQIDMDGKTIYSGLCFSIAVGTGKYSGGGLRQTPLAVSDDGFADVTVIPPLPFLKIICKVRRLFDGTFHKVKELTMGKFTTLQVRPLSVRSELVEVDGEIVGRMPVMFEVMREQIRVLHRFV